jgi:putative transposase
VTFYKNKFRIESTRLKNWDYSANGAYYITICVKNREYLFGNINDGKLILSDLGQFAERCWREIPIHFPFVQLDEFIIMPNHVHGIIIINKSDDMSPVETQNLASLQSSSKRNLPKTQNLASLQSSSKYGPQSKNIASIIRGYKIGVTKYSSNNNISFKWQPRFFDHIIRDDKSLQKIREYIVNNPINWQDDEMNQSNGKSKSF